MEIIDENKSQNESANTNTGANTNTNYSTSNNLATHQDNNKFLLGVAIVGIGCLLLAREVVGFDLPRWVFSWPMLLIVIGIVSGIKNSFQNAGSYILILIGGAFLMRNYFLPDFNLTHYMWPLVIIIIGVFLMVKPGKFFRSNSNSYSQGRKEFTNEWQTASTTGEEHIDSSAVFGSVKKNIVSKNFKGGEVNCVFGGSEINLSQADFEGTVQLEVNAVFGNMRVIVPSHWEIKSELTAVLGNVEDKRPLARSLAGGTSKVLILKGAAVFGGIEILSYV